MTRELAETLALRALAFIASDEKHLQYLISTSGLDTTNIRPEAMNPVFLGGVLDHLLANETLLLAFCEAEGLEPTAPARARTVLPGFSHDL